MSRWAVARDAIVSAMEQAAPGARVGHGQLTRLGGGLSRDAWHADVTVRPDPAGLSGEWLALVPRRDADTDLGEARLLQWLHGRTPAIRLPRALAPTGDVLVREALAGLELDLRAGKQPWVQPWQVVAQVAAVVHALEPPDFLPGHRTRREHALAELAALDELDTPTARRAREWALANLPPDDPSCLVHGDLLGQNVLIHFELPTALIDWEYARLGDPAHDLAIVTRGSGRPFKTDRGMERLLEAYSTAGGAALRPEDVWLYELCLFARWAANEVASGPPGHEVGLFEGLVRRVVG